MFTIGSLLNKQQADELALDAVRASDRLRLAFGEPQRDVRLLASLPVAKEILEEYHSGAPLKAELLDETQSLAEVFESCLTAKSTYDQVRLIAADGQELVRFDHVDGKLQRVPDSQLQSKAGRDYFQHAIASQPHTPYLSAISLNRERGIIETPHKPMLRVALRIDDKAGNALGLVAINQRVDEVLQGLFPLRLAKGEFYLLNSHGDYLIHPDASRTFGFEFGKPQRLQDDYEEVTDETFQAGYQASISLTDPQKQQLHFCRFRIAEAGEEKFLVLGLSAGPEAWLAARRYWLTLGGIIALLLCASTFAVALAVAKWQIRPLHLATEAALSVSQGQQLPDFTDVFQGEFGDLAHALKAMNDHLVETQRRKMEQANKQLAGLNDELQKQNLQASNDRQLLQTIINSIPQALFWKDRNSNYLGCNQAFAKLANLNDAAKIVGLDDYDLPWTLDETKLYREGDRRVMQEECRIVNLEESQTLPNGEVITVLTSKVPLRDPDGTIMGMVGLYGDVTEMKRAQQERDQLLSESGELARVIRESPAEVYIFDLVTLQFVEVNAGACKSTGYSYEEFKELTPLHLLQAFNESRFRSTLQPTISGQEPYVQIHANHRRKDGVEYPVRLSLHPTEYRGQSVCVAFVQDLTEVRLLEQRLAQAQKLEAIGQLSAGIAHEINTPMQYVQDNVEFLGDAMSRLTLVFDRYQDVLACETEDNWQDLRQDMAQVIKNLNFDKLSGQVFEAITECREGVDRTVTILQAMKNFSHPGDSKREMVDLNKAIASTVAICRNRWKYSAVVDMQLEENLPTIMGYGSELNQALLNLIVNASDAVDERYGDGTLGVITVRTRLLDNAVEIQVEDNGCGISDKTRDKIFTPFFTTKEIGKGTGQGLGIVRDVIVKLHHGEVKFDSQPDVGTKFTLTLPLSAAEEEQDSSVEDQLIGTP